MAYFNISLYLAFLNFRQMPVFLKRASLIVPVFILIHLSVGYVREVRYFLPLIPIYLPMALMNLERLLPALQTATTRSEFRTAPSHTHPQTHHR